MSHLVSDSFKQITAASVKSPQPGCLVSWDKSISDSVKFFTLDQSALDGPDMIMGSDSSSITFFDKFRYIDETANVQNFKVTKKISNHPWGVISATATITLNNTSKRYYPGYDDEIGEYVDLANRPIKLSMGLGGEFIKLFTGFTERPDAALVKRTVEIKAMDSVAYLETVKSALPAFVDTRAEDIIEALLVEQGFGYDQFDIEPSLQPPIGYLTCNDRAVADILADICEAEGYIIHADEDGKILGWNRNHLNSQLMDPQWLFDYSNMTDVSWSSSNIINSVQVTAKPYKPASWNKIWELDSSSDQTLVPANGTVDIFAEFKDDDYTFYAIDLDAPKPVAEANGSSSYLTNVNQDGSGATNASAISLQSYYNFGDSYRMTFKNSSSTPTYVTKITLFGQPAKVSAIKSSLHEDKTSIERYGINPDDNYTVYEVDNDLVQDVTAADTYAEALIDNYASPNTKLNVSNFPVPFLQFGDSVKVKIEDTGKSMLCTVFGYEIGLGVNANLTQNLYLESRDKSGPQFFTLDQSQLDGPDVLAL